MNNVHARVWIVHYIHVQGWPHAGMLNTMATGDDPSRIEVKGQQSYWGADSDPERRNIQYWGSGGGGREGERKGMVRRGSKRWEDEQRNWITDEKRPRRRSHINNWGGLHVGHRLCCCRFPIQMRWELGSSLWDLVTVIFRHNTHWPTVRIESNNRHMDGFVSPCVFAQADIEIIWYTKNKKFFLFHTVIWFKKSFFSEILG